MGSMEARRFLISSSRSFLSFVHLGVGTRNKQGDQHRGRFQFLFFLSGEFTKGHTLLILFLLLRLSRPGFINPGVMFSSAVLTTGFCVSSSAFCLLIGLGFNLRVVLFGPVFFAPRSEEHTSELQ